MKPSAASGILHASQDQIVLIHISDVHIGTSLMPRSETFRGGIYSGLNPHEYRLLRPLELAIREAKRRLCVADNEATPVVMSGDLTQAGLNNDYATAFALMHQRWQWARGPLPRWIGLGLSPDTVLTVPGNHDHWRHSTHQTGFTRGLSPDWFEVTPWRRRLESRGASIQLDLFGVDSNSGLEDELKKPGKRNLFAEGKISDHELTELEAALQESAADNDRQALIRIIVCHHAFSNKGGLFAARPLVDESRRVLVALAAKYGVSVVLTGHTHSFHEEDWPLGSGSTRFLKELRCATTLQGTKDPVGLQGFWVHQITRASGSPNCEWTAWKYQCGAKSFELDSKKPVKFDVP
jgi:3',5'-cyclic AMP phosphodiesterase CpdA